MSATAGLLDVLGRAWRARWTFAVPVAALGLAGSLYAVHLPDVYRASAALSAHTRSLERVTSDLPQGQEGRIESRLANLSDRLLARENVAEIVPILTPGAAPTDPVALVKAGERVRVDRQGEADFRVSIEDTDPARAARAVNRLVGSFLDAERTRQVERARANSEFSAGEATAAAAEEGLARDAARAFLASHPDAVPGQKEFLTGEVGRLETAAREKDGLASASRRVVEDYEGQIQRTPLVTAPVGPTTTTAEEEHLSLKLRSVQGALDAAERQLADLRTRYTDRMPAVQQVVAEIAGHRVAIEETKRALEAARGRGAETAADRRTTATQSVVDTLRTLREREREVGRETAREAAELHERAAALRGRLALLPPLEGSLRDLREKAEEVTKRRERLETEAKNAALTLKYYRTGPSGDVTGYSVVQEALPPALPSGPGRGRLVLTFLAAGLALGYLGVALARRAGGRTVHGADDVRDLLPEGVLVVSVPAIGAVAASRGDAARTAVLGAFVTLCVLGALFTISAFKGWIVTPEWFRPWLGRA